MNRRLFILSGNRRKGNAHLQSLSPTPTGEHLISLLDVLHFFKASQDKRTTKTYNLLPLKKIPRYAPVGVGGNGYCKTVLLLFLTLHALTTTAQPTLQPEQFLTQKITSYEQLYPQKNTSKTFDSSWIEQVDFRTETKEFDLETQRYLIRASPNSPKVRKAQKQLFQLYHKGNTLTLLEFKEKIVEDAYQELLDLYEHHQYRILKKELLLLLEDQKKVLGKLSQVKNSYVNNWINTIADIQDLQLEISAHESQLQQLLPNQQTIDWSNWITIDNITKNIQKPAIPSTTIASESFLLEQQLIEGEIELEEAEADRVFDFFQIEYQGRAIENFEEKVSFTAAFRFPFSSDRKLKIEELKVEMEVLSQEQKIKDYQILQDIQQQKQELEQQIQQWQLSKQFLVQLQEQSQQVLQSLQYQSKEGPLSILNYQTLIKKKEEDILDLKIGIYKNYLEYLILSKNIFQVPYQAFQAP